MSLALQARIGALEERIAKLEAIVAILTQASPNESLQPAIPETKPPPSQLISTIRETLRMPKRD